MALRLSSGRTSTFANLVCISNRAAKQIHDCSHYKFLTVLSVLLPWSANWRSRHRLRAHLQGARGLWKDNSPSHSSMHALLCWGKVRVALRSRQILLWAAEGWQIALQRRVQRWLKRLLGLLHGQVGCICLKRTPQTW